jgi:hypothetical protein
MGYAREPVFLIRIQTDRGQHVVTTGPYAFVGGDDERKGHLAELTNC